jgi:hypothetical protein
MADAKTQTIEDTWTTLITDQAGDFFLPTRDWRANPGVQKAQGWVEVRGIAGTGMSLKRGVQYTNDVRNPAGAVALPLSGAAYATTDGVKDPDPPTTLSVDAYRYVRDGYIVKVTTAPGYVRVRGGTKYFF